MLNVFPGVFLIMKKCQRDLSFLIITKTSSSSLREMLHNTNGECPLQEGVHQISDGAGHPLYGSGYPQDEDGRILRHNGPVPARYVRQGQMCPQLDVSDKNDKQKRKICPTKLYLSDKNEKKHRRTCQNKKYFVFCWRFPENANW